MRAKAVVRLGIGAPRRLQLDCFSPAARLGRSTRGLLPRRLPHTKS